MRKKAIKIDGKKFEIDPHQLMRMVKQVTQTIGEYKRMENPFAAYVINSMRKARSDMVSDLEHHFGLHWQIDEESGRSNFWL